MAIQIRYAENQRDREAIYRLRYELYVEDQGIHGAHANHRNRLLYDQHDSYSRLIMAEDEGRLVGSLRLNWGGDEPFDLERRREFQMERFEHLLEDHQMMVTSRFMARKEYRRGRVAGDMLALGMTFAAQHGVELIMANCEPHLVHHHKKSGYQAYGRMYNHHNNGLLVSIGVICSDLDYLRRIESPMLDPLSRGTVNPELAVQLRAIMKEDLAVANESSMGREEYRTYVDRMIRDFRTGEAALKTVLENSEDASALLTNSQVMECEAGDGLILKGHSSKTLYILLEGALGVWDENRMIARIEHSGALVGEMAFFTGQRRTSDVRAISGTCRVLALNERTLERAMKERPMAAVRFLYYFNRELCLKLGGSQHNEMPEAA